MSPKVADVLERVEGMTGAEKGELVDRLVESMGLSEEWMDEVEARAADSGARTYSWDEVLTEADAILAEEPRAAHPTP